MPQPISLYHVEADGQITFARVGALYPGRVPRAAFEPPCAQDKERERDRQQGPVFGAIESPAINQSGPGRGYARGVHRPGSAGVQAGLDLILHGVSCTLVHSYRISLRQFKRASIRSVILSLTLIE